MTRRTKVLFALYVPHLQRAGSYPHPAVTRSAAPWTINEGWVGNWGFHYHLVVMGVCCQGCAHPFQSSVRGGWLKQKLIKIQSPTHNIISKMSMSFFGYIVLIKNLSFCLFETEENDRMGKTRDLFKKIRDTKGTFHAKMGSIKNRNGMDVTEAEDFKKRWQEWKEELYKKDLHDPVNHNGVITHLEPDILECEVKWALGSITMKKASGGDGIPIELFQILKDNAVEVLHSICQQTWKTQQWSQDWKRSVFIPIPKKGSDKECSNYRTITLISHNSKVMLKILQARLQ